ncbi:MAG: GGDEF domain-containing protein [Nitrospiraceae bacterium]|nr:GGDEF domain-containing protein [Nitrospiraceae bacterium]
MLRYPESKISSAEIFRLVLQRMTELGFSFTPIHYAVVYEYVSGINPGLSDALDTLVKSGILPSDKDVENLFLRYVAPEYVLPLNDHRDSLTKEIQELLEKLSHSTLSTTHEAERVQKGMESYGASLQKNGMDEPKLKALIEAVLRDTHSIKESSASLSHDLSESQKKIEILQRELRTARAEALIDPLTELLNRRGLNARMEELLSDGRHTGKEMAVLMLDIDHFKTINDTHGHMVGDKAIVAVSRILKMCVRSPGDLAARVGGEEFALLLPGASSDEGFGVAEKIRKAVEKIEITNVTKRQKMGVMTISIGVDGARFGPDWNAMMERADKALYTSKALGRNKTTVFGNEITV